VLVSQLRDYLQAGWQGDSLGPRTTLHPLQPFSRRYFEAGPVEAGPEPETLTVTPGDGPASAAGLPGSPRGSAGGAGPGALFTYAGEWRAAHQAPAPVTGGSPRRLSASPAGTPEQPLDLEALSRFLRQPVRDFFRSRLGVVFREAPTVEDEEVFGLDALAQQHLLAEALEAAAPRAQGIDGGASDPVADPGAEAQARAALAVARLRAAGRLPLGAAGERAAAALQLEIAPMVARWLTLQAAHPLHAGRLKLHFEHAGLSVDDRMEGLRAAAAHSAGGDAAGAIVFVECQAVRMRDPKGWRAENLVAAWARTLLACACGWQLHSRIVARDGLVSALPLPQQEAAAALESLLATWLEGRASPLPVACRTALDFLSGAADPARSYEGAGATAWARGEVEDPCLARAYPDFDALGADGRFADLAGRLYRPLLDWIAAGVSFEPHDPAGDGGENHG
jgi:exodeoxyribonuclease V gamma subunit